jgi:23S rRNA pseudouridine1911/1915/1917 synthase
MTDQSEARGEAPQEQASLPQDVTYQAAPDSAGIRLDHFLVQECTGHSRSEITRLIRSGAILVNDQMVKPGRKLRQGDSISVSIPEQPPEQPLPRDIALNILYEDDSILIIDKPAGLVVHPGEGHRQDTLVNALLYHYPNLPGADPNRPGIVHRLDKDTSGTLVIAKNSVSLRRLSAAFKQREVQKTYHAILLRSPGPAQGRVVAPIGRHPVHRQKMAVRKEGNGRYAATRWEVLEAWPGFSLVEIAIETGRTHQIRVHMASLGAPVAGDILYGGRMKEIHGVPVSRQLLHASTLRFNHPETGQVVSCTAPLPPDMQQVLDQLRETQRNGIG